MYVQRTRKVHPAARRKFTEAGICANYYECNARQWWVVEYPHLPYESAIRKLEEDGFIVDKKGELLPDPKKRYHYTEL